MRIVLVSPVDGVIAWEEQFGEKEGWFTVIDNGEVVYRHSSDLRDWFCGATAAQFRAASAAWNRYCDGAVGLPEAQQLAAVERLRSELQRLGVLVDRPDGFWKVVLEQAQDGLL